MSSNTYDFKKDFNDFLQIIEQNVKAMAVGIEPNIVLSENLKLVFNIAHHLDRAQK